MQHRATGVRRLRQDDLIVDEPARLHAAERDEAGRPGPGRLTYELIHGFLSVGARLQAQRQPGVDDCAGLNIMRCEVA